MTIGDLLTGLPHRWVRGGPDLEVAGVTHDSRRAGHGFVFVAVRGAHDDGLRFAPKALAAGAGAVIVGRGRAGAGELGAAARLVEVDDERAALAILARGFFGRADEHLPVVGVTGTNGKTTTCQVAASILETSGVRTGVLGTVSYRAGGEEMTADRTTPEAPDLHAWLARMRKAGCGACVMEVSSHALDLKRVHGMRFASAVFTNLTRDHLDWHGDMEGYYRVKASLFEGLAPRAGRVPPAVVNVDDPYGRRLAEDLRPAAAEGRLSLVTVGRSEDASLRMEDVESDAHGCRLTLRAPEGRHTLRTRLPGLPNAYNVAQAAAVARGLGAGWEAIEAGAAATPPVPGRLERVETAAGAPRDFSVLVDYAHTDDALESLLVTVRAITPGRVLLVFGCGGDRDRTKRPVMGAHAARLADVVFVTSDNPRTERPESIIEEILAGVEPVMSAGAPGPRASRVEVEPDRRRAIEAAVAHARAGDAVVIAGKGHETYQIVGDRVLPFDDRAVARAAIERLLGHGSSGGVDA